MNFDIKSANNTRYSPCYVIFDILYLNGEVLTNKPLRERMKLLPQVVDQKDGLIMLSTVNTASTKSVPYSPAIVSVCIRVLWSDCTCLQQAVCGRAEPGY